MTNKELIEKELEAYHQGYWPKTNNGDESLSYTPDAVRRMVTHFYELGKQAKQDAPEGLDEAAVDGADTLLAKPKDYALAAKSDYWNGAHDGFKAGAEWENWRILQGGIRGKVEKVKFDKILRIKLPGDTKLNVGDDILVFVEIEDKLWRE